MADIEKYSTAFSDSKFQDQISTYALYALGQLNDQARLVSYQEKNCWRRIPIRCRHC